MAYIRGANYIFQNSERVHFWATDGFDSWQDSVWFVGVQSEATEGRPEVGPSGVGLDQAVADLYVVMRFAELVQQRLVREIAERAVDECAGNGGCLALQALAPRLIRVVEDLSTGDESS